MSAATAETPSSAMPLLDRLAPLPPPAKTAKGLAFAIGMSACAAVAAIFALRHSPGVREWMLTVAERFLEGPWTAARIVSTGCLAFVLLFAAVALHELGHLVVGLCAGFRFNSMRIGRIQVDPPFRISLYRGPGSGSGGWLGGWVNLHPGKSDKLVLRAIAMVAGGPAVNLLSACAVLLLLYAKGLPSWMFVFWSVVLGVVNLFPFRSQAVHSVASALKKMDECEELVSGLTNAVQRDTVLRLMRRSKAEMVISGS